MSLSSHIPSPVVRRLSLYLRPLEALQADRVATVSSRKLAQPLGLADAQIRKDLGYFGQLGRPGVGYEVMPLIHLLRSIFGTDRISNILLVGAGNLGKAVTTYRGFRVKGFKLVAIFDSDPKKIGRPVGQLFSRRSPLPPAKSFTAPISRSINASADSPSLHPCLIVSAVRSKPKNSPSMFSAAVYRPPGSAPDRGSFLAPGRVPTPTSVPPPDTSAPDSTHRADPS